MSIRCAFGIHILPPVDGYVRCVRCDDLLFRDDGGSLNKTHGSVLSSARCVRGRVSRSASMRSARRRSSAPTSRCTAGDRAHEVR